VVGLDVGLRVGVDVGALVGCVDSEGAGAIVGVEDGSEQGTTDGQAIVPGHIVETLSTKTLKSSKRESVKQ